MDEETPEEEVVGSLDPFKPFDPDDVPPLKKAHMPLIKFTWDVLQAILESDKVHGQVLYVGSDNYPVYAWTTKAYNSLVA